MNTTQKIIAIALTGGFAALMCCVGFVVGWHWFGYDLHHHPDWPIMNPEDGGFGQLGAIVTYCGTGALLGLLAGLCLGSGVWMWTERRLRHQKECGVLANDR